MVPDAVVFEQRPRELETKMSRCLGWSGGGEASKGSEEAFRPECAWLVTQLARGPAWLTQ